MMELNYILVEDEKDKQIVEQLTCDFVVGAETNEHGDLMEVKCLQPACAVLGSLNPAIQHKRKYLCDEHAKWAKAHSGCLTDYLPAGLL